MMANSVGKSFITDLAKSTRQLSCQKRIDHLRFAEPFPQPYEAWIIDVVGTQNEPITPGTGQTERWDTIQGSTRGAGSTEFTSSAGTFSMDWTKSVISNWAIIAAALKPAGTPCCVSIGDWIIDSISNDSIDPDIINNNETASIQGKTSYQIVNNEGVHVTFSTDNGATASSFVDAS